jgi:hypothetical protein
MGTACACFTVDAATSDIIAIRLATLPSAWADIGPTDFSL